MVPHHGRRVCCAGAWVDCEEADKAQRDRGLYICACHLYRVRLHLDPSLADRQPGALLHSASECASLPLKMRPFVSRFLPFTFT